MPDRDEVLQGLECCIRRLEGERVCDECPYDEDFNCLGCSIVLWQAIALLREQQEPMKPKKGVWLHPTSLDCCCSVCGRQPEHEPGGSVPLYPYCPNCGAKMGVSYDA